MKKGLILTLALLLSLPGCGKKKAESTKTKKNTKMSQQLDLFSSVNIPLSEQADAVDTQDDSKVLSFFDEESEEFTSIDDDYNIAVALSDENAANAQADSRDFAWVDAQNEDEFRNIYFSFNKYGVREDQKVSLEADISQLRQLIADADANQEKATIVVEGHSCHSAGVPSYNLALSEKRAKYIADRLVAEGISQDRIKVVGRGQDVPAVLNGKAISGSREDQWRNRRVEIHLIYS